MTIKKSVEYTKTQRNKTDKEKKKTIKKKPRMFFAKLLEKYREWAKMFKYEEEKLRKYLIEKLDMMCSQIVRSRDCAWQFVDCGSRWSTDSCNLTISYGSSHCCHWIDRGWWSHRWDFRNMWACCPLCNNPHFDSIWHKMALQFKIEWLYGRDVVRDMRKTKSKEKPRLDELVQLYDKILPVWEQIPIDWKW